MEDEEPDDDEMGVAETYADYWPAKCKNVRSSPAQFITIFTFF